MLYIPFTYNAIQSVPIDSHSSSFIMCVFIVSSISLFEIIDIVVTGCQGKKIFFEFFAGTAAVNPSSMSAFLVHFLVHF